MYLHSLKIKGFRKLENVEITFSPNTSFLIGANNAGKTSILKALDLFLSVKDKTESEEDYYKESDDALPSDIIEMEGEFRGIKKEVMADKSWRGFNARRVLKYTNDNEPEDYHLFYKRTLAVIQRKDFFDFFDLAVKNFPSEKDFTAKSGRPFGQPKSSSKKFRYSG
jgi:predicted ATP-dependent endonuclease of OLD family